MLILDIIIKKLNMSRVEMGKKVKLIGLAGLAVLLIASFTGATSSDSQTKGAVSQHQIVKDNARSSQVAKETAVDHSQTADVSKQPVSSEMAGQRSVSEQTDTPNTKQSVSQVAKATTQAADVTDQGLIGVAQAPLSYTGQYQFIMADIDELGRARDSHIQLTNAEEPTAKRASRLTYNPVGWHNYNFWYNQDGGAYGDKKAWLMARGHLVGYQFSGVNDEPRNLVPETAWMNAGNLVGLDESNQHSMLYYENQLDNWLANHPNYRLDYQVTPLYAGDELIPRKVRLAYVGLDQNGQPLTIKVGNSLEKTGQGGATVVYLDNVSPNAHLNYADGTATNTVMKGAVTAVPDDDQSSSSEATSQPNDSQARIVYVTGGGTSKVYWYSTANMPANTNKNNVVQMTEQEALQSGKRHSLTE